MLRHFRWLQAIENGGLIKSRDGFDQSLPDLEKSHAWRTLRLVGPSKTGHPSEVTDE